MGTQTYETTMYPPFGLSKTHPGFTPPTNKRKAYKPQKTAGYYFHVTLPRALLVTIILFYSFIFFPLFFLIFILCCFLKVVFRKFNLIIIN